ncbi:CRISPR-associated helicase, Cas3 family (plasmid) [Stanieria cyanosphaera PCC 7437]|uniref:CRISPR-associated helicase, Cas3 family n=1 Tax=Stanieria cyanosphaera (strain ATCC 29371 / PCC 7437) TaxID=111780 RepID=K9Y1X6_STAC7|nr:type I-D CRISPR-associated helicase Cas3' [Stanieria cyanosphaera]AFZ37992.1 CRISPR-associated helicase, Cas3 family [Stanieria cyanosphaera PCC 7437]
MKIYSIKLKPIYSCSALNIPKEIKLPDGWLLSWHQRETYLALNDPEVNVVINTGMTGDGKTLAGDLDVIFGDSLALKMYPTNELARDQEVSAREYLKQFELENKLRINRLSGQDLELYAEQEGIKKKTAIKTRADQSEIILTNPDILHYLHRGAYLTTYDNPDLLWNKIDKRFDLFVFDEFHVFSAPQIACIINTMLLIRHTNYRKKFLFLSATPDRDFIDRLVQAGFKVKVIDPVAENKYRFPTTQAEASELKKYNWREVSRQITLNFIALESGSTSSETWLKENSDRIIDLFIKYPGSKGAIILNSIAAVKRLVSYFAELLQPLGVNVGENTGLSGQYAKNQSLAADLVIGTSTIDVGVDFKINFLFFESADAGNFIQRLGRLGRHDGYEKDGEFIKFNNYIAYALVPNFLVERLFLKESAPLEVEQEYNRPFFHQVIRDEYRHINDFRGYYSRWGGVQSVKLCFQLGHPNIKARYKSDLKRLQQDCETVFNTSLKKTIGKIKGWEKEWKELSGNRSGNPIAEDASSFRGVSCLQCGLYDLTETNEADRYKTYGLPGILSNLEIETITKAEFDRLLAATSKKINTPIPKSRFNYCLGFMKLHRYREERLNWQFTYHGDLKDISEAYKVMVLTQIQVWQPENYWISQINKQLKKQALVSYVLPFAVAEIKNRLRLPMHFQIYPISDRTSIHDPSPLYSIAFGQSALLIDTLAHWLKSKGGKSWFI